MLEHYMLGPPGIRPGAPLDFRQATNNNVADGPVTVKQESNLSDKFCSACQLVIADRYFLQVDDRHYHEECLVCAECSTPLNASKTCYYRDYKHYCKEDYNRVYVTKCSRCQCCIGKKEVVMKVPPTGQVFHIDCFACYICGQILPQGAHYVLKHGQPYCRREFENEILYSSQDDDLDDGRQRDGRRGPKRPRTILTSVQRRQFKASFEISPKPCRKVREALAKETGLSVRVVQVWFQNQRAKMKKIQRKAKAEPDKEPKEERKTESPHSDHRHYLNALQMVDGDSNGNFTSATQPLNPNNPYSPDDAFGGHSNESFSSGDLSIDGTEAGFDLGEGEDDPNGNHPGDSNGNHHHHNRMIPPGPTPEMPSLSQSLHSVMHNPIDKLFMMQNSYFNADHV